MSEKSVDRQLSNPLNDQFRPASMLSSAQSHPALKPYAAPFRAIRPGKGGQSVTKKPIRRIGIVSVKQCSTPKTKRSYWELRYIDVTTGKEVKRRVSDASWDEVRMMAENLTRESYLGKGYLPGRSKTPGIEDGLIEALRLTNTLPHVRRERARLAIKFIEWLAERYPAVKTWEQLRPAMVRNRQGRDRPPQPGPGAPWPRIRPLPGSRPV